MSDTIKILSEEFSRGHQDSEGECVTCDKVVTGRRGYWRKTSYEYDDWDSYCRACALSYVEELLGRDEVTGD